MSTFPTMRLPQTTPFGGNRAQRDPFGDVPLDVPLTNVVNPVASQGGASVQSSRQQWGGGGQAYFAGGQGTSAFSPGLRYRQPGYAPNIGAGRSNTPLGRTNTLLGGGQQTGGLLGQLGEQLGTEVPLLQGAANRQFTRNTNAAGDLSGVVDRAGDIQTTADQTAGGLTSLAGDQRGEFEQGAADVLSGFKDQYAMDATALVGGIRRSMQPTLQAIRSGLRADGTMMTPAEQKDQMFALERQIGEQTQTSLTQLSSQYNQARAQLGTQLSGQRIDSQRAEAALHEQGASIRNAGQLAALQFEAQGRQGVADLIYRNPETVVSMFQGLLALAGVASAPGGRGLPRVPVGV